MARLDEEGFGGFGNYRGLPRPNWSAKRIVETSFMLSHIHSEPAVVGGAETVQHTASIHQHRSKDLSIIDGIVLTKNL